MGRRFWKRGVASQFWDSLSFWGFTQFLRLSQFWNCLSSEKHIQSCCFNTYFQWFSIFSEYHNKSQLIVMIFFQNTNLLISEIDDFVSTHIFSEFYQNSLKDLHLDKIITISWLLLSYSENIENHWNYVLIWCKVTNFRW